MQIGRVLFFNDITKSQDPLTHLRVCVGVNLDRPLIPRFFFQEENLSPSWLVFRYEGAFVHCKRCGRVGHRQTRYRKSLHRVRQDFALCLQSLCGDPDFVFVDPYMNSLYSA